MKIKNLAFFGIMAAIMGVAGTARADTTTVIASQAYVDAKDNLKQDNEKRIQTTKSDYDGLSKTDDQKKEDYPSMYTLEDSITAIGSNNFANKDLSNLTDTGKANVSAKGTYSSSIDYVTGTVGKAIKDLNDGKQDNLGGGEKAGKVVTATTEAGTVEYTSIDATVTADSDNLVTSGAVAAAIGDASTAVVNATDDNVVATNDANANLLKGTGLQKAVAHLKGNGAGKYTAGVDNSETANTGIKNETVSTAAKTAWDKTLEDKKGDDYLTTLAAVERRVQEGVKDAVTQAGSNISSDTKSATANNMVTSVTTANGVVTAVGSAQVTDAYVASDAGIASTKLNVGTGYDSSTATGSVETTDSVQTALAKIEHKANNAGTDAIDTLDVTDDAADGRPVVKVNQTDGAVDPVRGTITYKDGLDYKLSSINSENGDGSAACTKNSPCTLTMFMDSNKPVYEWTNMDTENTNAVL